MKLSENLSLQEVIKSPTAIKNGIDNTPSEEHLTNLIALAINVFQPIRNWLGKPLGVTSGYRSPKLNALIGGSTGSQHSKGCALDIDADVFGYSNNTEIFHFIKDNLKFDQLIAEFVENGKPAWIHVSYVTNRANRKQVLIATKKGSKTVYLPYTEELYNSIYS